MLALLRCSQPLSMLPMQRVHVKTRGSTTVARCRACVQVLEYCSQGAASSHAAYIASLPGVAPGVPAPGLVMFFSDDELQATQSQGLATDAVSQRYWWRHFADNTLMALPGSDADPFGGQRVDAERLGWALAVATSRSFAIRQIGGHTMVPLVDMCDHSPASNAEVRAAGLLRCLLDAWVPLALGAACSSCCR